MNPQELRIGNLVNVPDHFHGGIFEKRVLELKEKWIKVAYTQECAAVDFHYTKAEPIQLTTERLIKFGFKHYDDSRGKNYYHIDRFVIVAHKYKDNYFHSINLNNSFNAVHSLQNLYYALTGKELVPV